MESDKIEFNTMWFTVFVELTRIFAEILKEKSAITVTQYRILLELHASGGSLPAYELANRLVVKPPSITNATDYLEHQGLVKRETNISDRRLVSITLLEKGKKLSDEASEFLSEIINVLWQDFSDEDTKIIVESTRYVAGGLKGYSYVNNGGKIQPFYITAIVTMTQLWGECIKKNYRFSLSEARILMLLNRSEQLMNGAKIASLLALDTSGVSRAITKLNDQGLLERVSPQNNRKSYFVKLTERGKEVACSLENDLTNINDTFYGAVPQKYYESLNELNVGMYKAVLRQRALTFGSALSRFL